MIQALSAYITYIYRYMNNLHMMKFSSTSWTCKYVCLGFSMLILKKFSELWRAWIFYLRIKELFYGYSFEGQSLSLLLFLITVISITIEIKEYVQRAAKYLYPKVGRFCKNNFLKLLTGSQPIIEGRSSICGRRG